MNTMATPHMSIELSPTLDQLADSIMRLPRELRDMVWAYTVQQEEPVNITKSIAQFNVANTTILAELREAAYTHNTLVVTFSNPAHIQDDTTPAIWGAHPEYKRHIQTLIVEVTEPPTYPTDLLAREGEYPRSESSLRKQWNELLYLPRLESLTINMQKLSATRFGWPVFTPILLQLRSSLPKLHITFNISFDDLLKPRWDDEAWDLAGSTVPLNADEYDPMGFVDITELFDSPSEGDKEYVEEHCRERKEVVGRDAMRGLVYEYAQDRRELAMHYVVKEPELLRVMIQEHYEISKRAGVEGNVV
jgi:hypothetical protein